MQADTGTGGVASPRRAGAIPSIIWTIGWQPNYRAEARIYATYILQHYTNARIVTRRLRYALQHGAPRLLQGRRT